MESTSSLTSMLSASSTSKVEVTLLRFNSQQNPDVDKKTATIGTLSTGLRAAVGTTDARRLHLTNQITSEQNVETQRQHDAVWEEASRPANHQR
jgi:hypothetical protein